MEKPLLLGTWGDSLYVFQTRGDEEDAENDDLNDAGESSSNTQLFCWGEPGLAPSARVQGLWEWRLSRQQLCNIQQKRHKRDRRDWKHWQGLTRTISS